MPPCGRAGRVRAVGNNGLIRRRLGPAGLGLSIALATGTPVDAQSLRGRVLAEGATGPVEGAFITLTDSTGRRVDSGLSDSGGYYLLRAGAGSYVLRVERIGFETWTSPPVEIRAGEDRTLELSIPVRPVRLAELDVRVHTGCLDQRDDGSAIWQVWDEARKALETAVFADESELFRFNTFVFDRLLEPTDLVLLRADTVLVKGATRTPFHSLDAKLLAREGYIRNVADTVYFYAPDAAVLMSSEFLDTHCFGLDTTLPDLVGLTFGPAENRKLPDIAGVMWLDTETAELRHLEFRYANFPYRIPAERLGGWIDFVRLPGGPFVVERWWLRTPHVRMGDRGPRIDGYVEHGGLIADVFTAAGRRIDWHR